MAQYYEDFLEAPEDWYKNFFSRDIGQQKNMKVSDLENARKYVARIERLRGFLGVIERQRDKEDPISLRTSARDEIPITGHARRMVLMMAEAHVCDKLDEYKQKLKEMGVDLEGEKA